MSTLVAILFDTPRDAQLARLDFARMQREHLVELEDSVVVFKDEKSKVRLDQSVNLTASGAASGGFWGLLLGALLALPLGGPLAPLVGAAFGASLGALSGHLADYGIDDEMMKTIGEGIDDGKAALFVLVRAATIDRVIAKLSKYEGEVLKTSLPFAVEERLRQVLAAADQRVAATEPEASESPPTQRRRAQGSSQSSTAPADWPWRERSDQA